MGRSANITNSLIMHVSLVSVLRNSILDVVRKVFWGSKGKVKEWVVLQWSNGLGGGGIEMANIPAGVSQTLLYLRNQECTQPGSVLI